MTGQIMGTPSYMSPEQIRGDSLTPSSDIFGVGVVLYEMITGSGPFSADSQIATTHSVLHKRPVHPKRFRPGVPRKLSRVIMKCLQKNPGRRFSTMGELTAALSRTIPKQAPRRTEAVARLVAESGWKSGIRPQPSEPSAGSPKAARTDTLPIQATAESPSDLEAAVHASADPVPPDPVLPGSPYPSESGPSISPLPTALFKPHEVTLGFRDDPKMGDKVEEKAHEESTAGQRRTTWRIRVLTAMLLLASAVIYLVLSSGLHFEDTGTEGSTWILRPGRTESGPQSSLSERKFIRNRQR